MTEISLTYTTVQRTTQRGVPRALADQWERAQGRSLRGQHGGEYLSVRKLWIVSRFIDITLFNTYESAISWMTRNDMALALFLHRLVLPLLRILKAQLLFHRSYRQANPFDYRRWAPNIRNQVIIG